MKAAEVCEVLGITRANLTDFIEQGLPHQGTKRSPTFDESTVVAWLLENELAEPNKIILKTVKEVAEYYNEKPRTIKDWMEVQGCPGSPGCYVVEEIDDWIATEKRPRGGQPKRRASNSEQDDGEGLSIQDELRLLKLENARGQLISLEDVKSEYIRQSTMIRSEFGMIAGKIESRLPGNLDPEIVAMIRDSINTVVEDCISIFAELDRDDWGEQ